MSDPTARGDRRICAEVYRAYEQAGTQLLAAMVGPTD